ncbi:uncharacterized protein LOC119089641, partial [Pollicipes pollicipes]|uniref:uncharacterized protein LOC119089641 n=1 Tax=Pollicipes pollicipes TaxID=41117 RepID=UPI0018849E6A
MLILEGSFDWLFAGLQTRLRTRSICRLNIPSGGLYAMSEQSYQPPSLGDEEFELPPLMSDGVGHGGQQGGMYSPAMEMSMPMTSTVDTMTSGGYHPHHPHQQQHHHMYYGQEGLRTRSIC